MKALLMAILVLAMLVPLLHGQDPGASLYAQAASRILEKEFSNPDVSFLLIDVRTGELAASHWPDREKPIPFGSLVKPFAALAFSYTHDLSYPVHVCYGEASGCWQPHGHGRMDIASAISHSCNSYFRALTQDLRGEQVLSTARAFGLDAPEPALTGPALMGMGDQWKISPAHMARAYLELYRRRDQPGVVPLLTGMAQSARRGTGLGVGLALKNGAALVKTGTAPCTHTPRSPGDGFAIALVPAGRVPLLLLLRVHGVPGSKAAATAGHMFQRLEE